MTTDLWASAPEQYQRPVRMGDDWDDWTPEPPHELGFVQYATTPDGEPLALIPRGRTSLIFGPPGTGKSFVSAHLTAEVLANGGTVVLLDFEGSRGEVQGRLRSMGVDADGARRFWYWQADGSLLGEWYDPETDEVLPSRLAFMKAWLADVRPDLVVLDGVGAALTTAGLSENSNQEASSFDRKAIRPLLAAAGEQAAMLLIDHVGKAGDDDARPMGPRGASSKLADVSGVSWRYSRIGTGFSRGQDGAGQLVPTKDRTGWWSVGDAVTFTVVSNPDGSIETSLKKQLAKRDEQGRPVVLMQQCSRFLESLPDKTASKSKIAASVTGKGTAIAEAVEALERAGHIVHTGSGPTSAFKLLSPFKVGLPYEQAPSPGGGDLF